MRFEKFEPEPETEPEPLGPNPGRVPNATL